MVISALGIDHYQLIVENNTNNEITVERNHKIDGLNLDMNSDSKIQANETRSYVVTIANNCKDSLLRVKNQNQECLPDGFAFPVQIRSTEESEKLPVTKLTIVELNNNNPKKKHKEKKEKGINDNCKVRIEEINK